jgi:hypothetical protein
LSPCRAWISNTPLGAGGRPHKEKKMKFRTAKRKLLTTLVVFTFASAISLLASTSGAHFFADTTDSVSLSTGALVVTIDEAGVGQSQVNYTVSVNSASATYACINGGGNHPSATNKETVSSSLNLPLGTFSPINGRVQVTVSLNGTPLSAGSFACPSGQTLVLAAVSYSGITLTDTTNNVSVALPDATHTFFNLK